MGSNWNNLNNYKVINYYISGCNFVFLVDELNRNLAVYQQGAPYPNLNMNSFLGLMREYTLGIPYSRLTRRG